MFSSEILLAFICFSSLSLWFFPKKEISISLALAFSFITFFLGFISYASLLLIVLFALTCFFYQNNKNKFVKFLLFILICVFATLTMKGVLPGSKHVPIFDGVRFSPISAPFWMGINIEKSVCGILFAAFLIKKGRSFSDWKKILKEFPVPLITLVIVLIVPALLTHFVKFNFKIPEGTMFFVANNLLLTCLAEEVFFRAFLQKSIYDFSLNNLKMKQSAPLFSLLVASAIFGAFHLHDGLLFATFAFIAGIGYGYTYQKSGKLESAILVHFGFNFVHFLFFTYPAYKP